MADERLRLAVLVSGSGSNLQAILDAIEAGRLSAEVVLVVCNVADARGLQRALRHRLPAVYLPLKSYRTAAVRDTFEERLAGTIAAFSPDLVVLAGWMVILSPAFLERFPDRIVNLHPALLPDGPGNQVRTRAGVLQPVFRGAHAVRDALAAGVPVTGTTLHYITAEPDSGPVIASEEVPILPGDTEETLHERIKAVEHRLLPQALQQLARTLRQTV